MRSWINTTHVGDCRTLMRAMAADGVRAQCIVTSPPYWGLRDYGVAGQFGLERTWLRHVARMRHVFRLARGLLADDGLLWLNYGDSYYTPRPPGGVGANSTINGKRSQEEFRRAARNMKSRIQPPDVDGPNRRAQRLLKAKDMVGMPWRIALALQADGWWLRSDVIWHKTNPMPESTKSRPTKSHEYLFLLARSEQYFYDAASIAEPTNGGAHPRGNGVNRKIKMPDGWDTRAGAHGKFHRDGREKGRTTSKQNPSFSASVTELVETRNVRTVWSIPTEAFSAAHFATFPRELVRRCILAASRPGDIVLDPFMGSGTVAEVAQSLGRRFIGCELNPEYAAMFSTHRSQQQGMAI